jgi:hypothetical protein
MHVVHTILVSLPLDDNGQPVVSAAAPAVAAAIPGLEERGAWYDWWSVGGRWDGYFSEMFSHLNLEDGNVLPVKGHEAEVVQFLERAQKRIDAAFCEFRDQITGAKVAESDVDGVVFGLPVAASAEEAQRRTAENAAVAGAWQRILTSDTLETYHSERGIHWDEYRPVYAITAIADLINGVWNDESGYLDTIENTARPARLAQVLHEPDKHADRYPLNSLALVTVDFHF